MTVSWHLWFRFLQQSGNWHNIININGHLAQLEIAVLNTLLVN